MAISKVTSGGIADGTLSVEDIADDAVTAAKLANSINTDIATGVTGNTTANAALPKAGGTMTGNIVSGDNVKATYGAAGDLEIYHDATDSYVKDNGTGNLLLQGTNLNLQSTAAENYIRCTADAQVELYHNNAKKFETTANGVSANGRVEATGDVSGSNFSSHTSFTGDCDTVKKSGFYRINTGSTNQPVSGVYFTMVVYGNGANVTAQLATRLIVNTTYTRSFNTSWSAWVQL